MPNFVPLNYNSWSVRSQHWGRGGFDLLQTFPFTRRINLNLVALLQCQSPIAELSTENLIHWRPLPRGVGRPKFNHIYINPL